MTELKQALKRSSPGSDIRRSGLELITEGLMPLLNRLPEEFFRQPADERRAVIEAHTRPGSLRGLARDRFATGTYAGLASELHRFAKSFGPCPLIVVQSAVRLEPERRLDLQAALAKSHPGSLIMFQTRPDLGGGLRIFADGKLLDGTWRGRLSTIISRIHEYTYA